LYQQLNNLKTGAGVESMLFVSCGTTDLPMRGVAFATAGVENFLEGTMKIDTQDFLAKMEGFAVLGVQGLNKQYLRQCNVLIH
jgi:hypothetical protein